MIALQLKATESLDESIDGVLPLLADKMSGKVPGGKFVVARNARALARPDEQPEQVHAPTLAYVTLKGIQAKARDTRAHGQQDFEQIISFDAAQCVQMELLQYQKELGARGLALPLALYDVLWQATKYVELVEKMDRDAKRAEAVRRNSGSLRRPRKVRGRAKR